MSTDRIRRVTTGIFQHDVRLAFRRLGRERGLATAAILTLAVGIGACTAMFSVVHAVLLKSLGIADPDRVVVMWPQLGDTASEFTYNDYRDIGRRSTSFERVAITGSTNWPSEIVLDNGRNAPATQCGTSGEFFEVLGAKAQLGRTFRAEDDRPGARPVAVLSAAFWMKYFGGDPNVVGRTLRVREKAAVVPFEVIGVMPGDFFYPSGAEYWTPAASLLARLADDPTPRGIALILDGVGTFRALGRLKPGVSTAAAESEVGRIRKMTAPSGVDVSTIRVAVRPILDDVFGQARKALVLLMGAVGLVLFVACANVAGLLVARAASRTREVAVRAALGASAWRLVRESIVEAGILAVTGGALGVSVAALALRALIALSPTSIVRLDQTRIDVTVLGVSVLITVTVTVLVGLIPAWHLRRSSVAHPMQGVSTRDSGRHVRAGVRHALVVTQVAITLVLLVASALAVQSFSKLTSLDLGFDPSNVLTFEVNGLGEARYPERAERHRIVAELTARMERLPQVRSAAAVLLRPFSHGVIGWDSGLLFEGQLDTPATWLGNPSVNWEAVTPHYFRTMGIRLIQGREFTEADREQAPLVAIISEITAARAWPGQNPIGKRFVDSFVGKQLISSVMSGSTQPPPVRWQTVVGVVATSRYREIENPRADLYVPLAQADDFDPESFVVRTSGNPQSLAPTIAAEISGVDRGLSLAEPTTMEEIVRRVQAPWHFNMLVFSMFGAVSIGLTAIGLFGLIAYTVTWRRREIGVRIALGARARSVVTMIVFQGIWLIAAGLAIGGVATIFVTRLMSSLLFQVQPTDPVALTVAAGALVVLAGLACYLPARRAAALDPSIVFRDE
jgi:predicted permease